MTEFNRSVVLENRPKPYPEIDFTGLDPAEIDDLKIYLDEINRVPLLSAQDEIDLADIIEDGSIEARQKMAEANLRLAVSIATRYQNRGVRLPDLIQEGNVGLVKAVGRFDRRRGNKFSTHAFPWIRKSILSAIDEQADLIRLPVYLKTKIRKLNKQIGHLTQALGHEPTDNELEIFEGEGAVRLRQIELNYPYPISLNQPTGTDDGSELGDSTPDEQSEKLDFNLEQEELVKLIGEVLKSNILSDRETEVLRSRYGFNGECLYPWEIGEKLNLSAEGVRQIEIKALKKLREEARLKDWVNG